MTKDNFPTQDIDVFISYKREERGLAVQVGRALNNAGFSYITDIDLETDEHFADAVDKRLRRSRLILVLWTTRSAASTWVRNEARFGIRRNRYMGVELEDLGLEMAADLDGLHRDVVANNRPLKTVLPEIVEITRKRLGDRAAPILPASPEELDFSADNMAFETAERVDTKDSYTEYLSRFPNGYMAAEAQRRFVQAGTARYWLGKNKIFTATVIGITVTFASTMIAPMFEHAPYAGGLTASEESALRSQRNTLQTEVDRIKPMAERVPTLEAQMAEAKTAANASTAKLITAQARIKTLTSQLSRARTDLATAEKDHSQDTAKAKSAHAAEVARLNTTLTGRRGQMADLNAAALAQQSSADQVARSIPPPDCTADDGKDGYRLPAKGGGNYQCVSITVNDLNLYGSALTNNDMPKLARLTNLNGLDIGNSQVEDISALSSLANLKRLVLSHTQVRDFSALRSLADLQTLFLSYTHVDDIFALSDLTNLQWLTLYKTQVDDISALSGLSNLRYLQLPDGTPVGDYSSNTPEARAAVQEVISTWSR